MKKILLSLIVFNLLADPTKALLLKDNDNETKPLLAAMVAQQPAAMLMLIDQTKQNQQEKSNRLKEARECCLGCGVCLYIAACPLMTTATFCFCNTPQFWPIMGPGIASALVGSYSVTTLCMESEKMRQGATRTPFLSTC